MRNPKIITMLALMISLLCAFASDANAQTVKQDSVIFYKDTVLVYDYTHTPTYWVGIPNNIFIVTDIINHKNDTIYNSTELKLTKQFNQKVTIDSIKINFIQYDFLNVTVDVFSINNSTFYKFDATSNIVKTYNFDTLKTDSLNIRFYAYKKNQTVLYILNPTVCYHYTDNTSINDVKANTPDIQFINNKFESTTKIDNIKVYDITGKLIQEGTINDTYQLDNNTLYFVIFDNKFSKKIITL